MTSFCAVHTCNKIAKHRPRNSILRDQWVRALRLEVVERNRQAMKSIYVCSEHFKPTDFIITQPLSGKYNNNTYFVNKLYLNYSFQYLYTYTEYDTYFSSLV